MAWILLYLIVNTGCLSNRMWEYRMITLAELNPTQFALDTFLKHYPSYRSTEILDRIRAREYSHLDHSGQIYLDHTGAALYAESQILRHQEMLSDLIFGNPHSESPASKVTESLIEQSREHVLRFFNADPDEYVAIFVANASHALKLVGESYPFSNGRLLLTFDNHNSVNGIREFAHAQGAAVSYVPILLGDMQIDAAALEAELSQPARDGRNLFAYPAQSNFSGVQHPLEWIASAQDAGWDVILDAAAFVPTNKLDLSQVKPDFVPISFYKMFGYPTGVGALIARKEALARLHRPWFSGGTIAVATVQAEKHRFAAGAEAFEDGTPNFLSIPAIDVGLNQIELIGYGTIHERVRCLTGWLLENLAWMKHSSGKGLVRIFGPNGTENRGGIIAMHFHDSDGRIIDHHFIESQASKHHISLRAGCFCNPGAGEVALAMSRGEIASCFNQTERQQELSRIDFLKCMNRESAAAVRVSLGMISNFQDIEYFLEFAESLLD